MARLRSFAATGCTLLLTVPAGAGNLEGAAARGADACVSGPAAGGKRTLEAALNVSVPTTFNGDPARIYEGLGVTGKGVGIAVVDSGIDGTHPDVRFPARTKRNVRLLFSHQDFGPCVYPNDVTTDGFGDIQFPPLADTEVSSGHGTHMASVAAGDGSASGGRYRGVAWEADIMGVGIADSTAPIVDVYDPTRPDTPRTTRFSFISAIGGIDYAKNNGLEVEEGDPLRVKVILAGWTVDGLYDRDEPLDNAIDSAGFFDIPVVMPAGNEGPAPSSCDAAETCRINALAPHPNVITVAAGPRSARDGLAAFSSRGDPVVRTITASSGETYEARYEPFITAPGVAVTAARRVGTASVPAPVPFSPASGGAAKQTKLSPGYVPLSGTSVAAAHVAGVIVLMQEAAVRAKGCYLSVPQVRQILAGTATPIPGRERHEVGAGMIDGTAAVEAAREAPAQPLQAEYRCPAPGRT